jgi:hypothetical protein
VNMAGAACWTNPNGPCPLRFWSLCAPPGSECRCDAVLDGHSVHVSACVWPVESASRDAKAFAISCTAERRPGSNQKRKELGFCCRRDPMMLHRPGADLVTCTCLPSRGGQPHLTPPKRLDVLVEAGRGGRVQLVLMLI